jgi:hypothetical protein
MRQGGSDEKITKWPYILWSTWLSCVILCVLSILLFLSFSHQCTLLCLGFGSGDILFLSFSYHCELFCLCLGSGDILFLSGLSGIDSLLFFGLGIVNALFLYQLSLFLLFSLC